MDPSNSSVIYAGNQRIFKTTNRGGNWTAVDIEWVSGLSINPSNTTSVYAATSWGIFASEDAGASWTNVSSGLPSQFAYTVKVDPTSPMTIFAGISDHGTSKSPFNGVFKSTNGGVSWRFVGSDLEGSSAEVLALAPSDAKTIYAGGLAGLFKSTDGGASWSKVYSGPDSGRVTAIAIDPSDAKTIFMGTERGLLKTTNGGAHWTQIAIGVNPDRIASIAIDPLAKGIVYVGTSETVFMSPNGGKTWKWVSEGLPVIRITALVIDPSDHETVYAATAGSSIFKRRFKAPNQDKPAPNSPPKAAPVLSANDGDVTANPAVDSPPVPLNRPRPHYTEEARRRQISGLVRLRILIGADGSVEKLEVIEGLPCGLTEEAASAVSKLKFKPAIKDGRPTSYWYPISVEFLNR